MNTVNDNYPVAAVRHYMDAQILASHGRMDNAMCHYAFCAECVIKNLYNRIPKNDLRLGHKVNENWEDIRQFFQILEVMDPKTGAILGQLNLPDRLFYHHPERRYENDTAYSENDLKAALEFSGGLMKEVVLEQRCKWAFVFFDRCIRSGQRCGSEQFEKYIEKRVGQLFSRECLCKTEPQ